MLLILRQVCSWGIPGMLLGLHRAHKMYGSLSWNDVVSRAADVARDGFNVSHSLATAISKLETEKIEGRFRDIFIPDGQALRLGSYLKMPDLADVLRAGLRNFYHGAISQEIEQEVQANGGVLTREDIRNYSVEVQQPLEGQYNVLTKKQVLKTALTMVGELDEPHYNSSVTDLLSAMMSSTGQAAGLQQRMKDFPQSPLASNSTTYLFPAEQLTGQVVIMRPDGLMVCVARSLNWTFGSRIVTESGILLNSLILNFCPNKRRDQPQTNQKNSMEPARRPLTFLMPAVMIPTWNKCGTYMALSSSGGPHRLSEVTQMLVSLLFLHKDKNDTRSLGGPLPQPSDCI
ncbi:hypothetical protein CHARACLAT_029993 [Characodon lateralis]|uniref:Uncharacterized protein n=1 Tax=Characodon lateralis TaxID=208331 RepID=A0ABU7D4N1_9TELE|nr:hypothetical protein [Characodon lateralis]